MTHKEMDQNLGAGSNHGSLDWSCVDRSRVLQSAFLGGEGLWGVGLGMLGPLEPVGVRCGINDDPVSFHKVRSDVN